MEINERIFALLDGKLRTEAQLAKFLGLSTGQISTWKKRKTDPPAKYITRICEYLEVPLSYLLGNTNYSVEHLNENEKEFLNIIKKLASDRDQAKLIGYSECYAKTLPSYSENECDLKQEASNE